MTSRPAIRNGILTVLEHLGVARLYRARVRKDGPLTRIVVFHDVPDRAWFTDMIEVLARETKVLTPEEFKADIRDETKLNTLISFDDGYASWIDVALPVLGAYNFQALFFINSGLLDAAGEKEATERFMREGLQIHPRAPLTWEGGKELLARGHTIGGHAKTHRDLTKLEPVSLEGELTNDKVTLEDRLKITVTDFAYPVGTRSHVNDVVRAKVEEVGYERAYTAVSRFVRPQFGSYLIPRMCIEDGLTKAQLRKWLHGSYDLFDMLKSVCVR